MNREKAEELDALLVKSLLGEATPAENEEVAALLATDADARMRHAHYRTILGETITVEGAPAVDADAAWMRFQTRVSQQPRGRIIPLPSRAVFLRLAAMLVLALGIGGLWRWAGTPAEEVIASGNQVVVVTLPDGSKATLNKASTLRYPGRFTGGTRAVSLEGEAFFEVARDAAHPFTIKSGEAEVTVLGTSFNVKTTSAQTEVVVETGRVRVAKAAQAVELQPGDAATVLRSRSGVEKHKAGDALHNYYRTGSFRCHRTSLDRFVRVLSEAYATDIRIADPALRALPLTATFRGASLEEILDVLSATFPEVQVDRRGTTIVLK